MTKNTITKRLFLYIGISFLLTWLPTFAYMASGGTYADPKMQLLLSFSMLCPAIAMLLTRKVTKEGFEVIGKDSLLLGIDLKNKKWIWYLAAFLAPIVYSDLGQLLYMAIVPESYNPDGFDMLGIPRGWLVLIPISGVVIGVIGSVGALGEELGWRAYMYPKLEKLMGPVGSVIVGGIIWAVWHFPANTMGHNFGTDYWGEPWSGFLAFAISATSIGAILYLLTKKTGSIWPAVFMHAANNSGGRALALCLDTSKVEGMLGESPIQSLIEGVPLCIMGIIAIIMICKMEKK